MQSLKQWSPWIAAIAGAGFLGNGGYVLNAALNMDSSNISVIAQAVFSLLLGLGGVGYAAKSKGVESVASSFDSDVEAVKHLATTCKECKKSSDALQVIHTQILQRELEPDA
jgi:hypothetical protein